jgi:hypothetical protein
MAELGLAVDQCHLLVLEIGIFEFAGQFNAHGPAAYNEHMASLLDLLSNLL